VPLRRPRGVIGKGWACYRSAATGRPEHIPTSLDYPDTVVRRIRFEAGAGLKWTLSALETPREAPPPWKIVVITGAPSWAEYWAPAMAAQPAERQMVVVDRPGYGFSEPATPVRDIREQAAALAPLLDAPRGQKVLLVGQSYGAAIASVMAANNHRKVDGLVLLSGYFGEPGPTAKWLLDAGARMSRVIPRDLRTAVDEVRGQPSQLGHARDALNRLRVPVHIIHGDKDDFAPFDIAERLATEIRSRQPVRFERVPGANHFMAEGPVDVLIEAIERCIPKPRPRTWRDRVEAAAATAFAHAWVRGRKLLPLPAPSTARLPAE
jgi:pimeloyl-ACP methyl ester carboxylesterase